MDYFKKVVKSVIAPEDHYVLWIDTSTPEFPIMKLYNNGWIPLIADRLIKQTFTIIPHCYVRGSDGDLVYDANSSVAEITIQSGEKLYFLGRTRKDINDCSGYAFYDATTTTIISNCFPMAAELADSDLVELEVRIPNEAVKFRTTINGNITEENFYCNIGTLYVDQTKLEQSEIRYETTQYWNNQIGYIPKAGDIIIYSDYQLVTDDGETIYVPGIKIGSGNAYVQDLAFIDQKVSQDLLNHSTNTIIHTTASEKLFWNRKLNVDDNMEVIDEETLLFNRN